MNFSEHRIEWDDAKVSRLWDYYSRTPPYSEVYFSKVYGGRILQRSELPLHEPLQVLDFGCGPGFIWDHILQLHARWQYTALDFSPDSVAKVRQKAQGHAQFKGVYHVTRLPTELAAVQFDAVLLFEVVEHLKDKYLDSTLAEAARLLKPGGVVVVTTPNDEDLSTSTKFCPECGAVFHEWQHVRSWSAGGLTARMKQHRFELQMAQTLDFKAQGLLQQGIRLARRLLLGSTSMPHLIAVYQKF